MIRVICRGEISHQWPHMEGNGTHLPTPGLMCSTSYSESSGGKYRSVREGRTSVLALMLLIASSKSAGPDGMAIGRWYQSDQWMHIAIRVEAAAKNLQLTAVVRALLRAVGDLPGA